MCYNCDPTLSLFTATKLRRNSTSAKSTLEAAGGGEAAAATGTILLGRAPPRPAAGDGAGDGFFRSFLLETSREMAEELRLAVR